MSDEQDKQEITQDKQDRRDDTELRRTDTDQRAADTEQRAADTEQRILDSTIRSEDSTARAMDRSTDAARRQSELAKAAGLAVGVASLAAENVRQAEERAEVTRQEVEEIIRRSQTKRFRQQLIMYCLLIFALVLFFWRTERADNDIERNSARIEQVFRTQCASLTQGHIAFNESSESMAQFIEGFRATSTNPAAVDEFANKYRSQQLPVPIEGC